jgi:hypothetical protein
MHAADDSHRPAGPGDTNRPTGRRDPHEHRGSAERHPDPGRRPGLGGDRSLRAGEDPHSEPGSTGERGHAIHAVLFREPGMRSGALRAADRLAYRTRLRSWQQGDGGLGARRAGGTAPHAGGDRDPGRGPAREGPRHLRRGQVGPGWPGFERAPPAPGLRPLLRLALPARRPQSLSDPSVAKPRRGRARRQPLVLGPPTPRGGSRLRARARARTRSGRVTSELATPRMR